MHIMMWLHRQRRGALANFHLAFVTRPLAFCKPKAGALVVVTVRRGHGGHGESEWSSLVVHTAFVDRFAGRGEKAGPRHFTGSWEATNGKSSRNFDHCWRFTRKQCSWTGPVLVHQYVLCLQNARKPGPEQGSYGTAETNELVAVSWQMLSALCRTNGWTDGKSQRYIAQKMPLAFAYS